VIEARGALTKTIPFNSWMIKRWGKASYSLRTYVRSTYGHARAAREEAEAVKKLVTNEVIPLLQEIAQGRTLSVQDVNRIANAAAGAVDDGIAVDVLDELVERLDDASDEPGDED
jgi:ClpP class serine protease